MADGRCFCMYANYFDIKGGRIYLGTSPSYNKDNRVIVPVEYIASSEQIFIHDLDKSHKGQLTIKRHDFVEAGFVPSGRDFFQVIRNAYQQNKSIRVYLSDNRVLDGKSTGMNEQSLGMQLSTGNNIQIFYDWVDRIIPF